MPPSPNADNEADLVVLQTLNRNVSIASPTMQSMKKMSRIEWSSTSRVEIDPLPLSEARLSLAGVHDGLMIASGAQVAALKAEIMIDIVAGPIAAVLDVVISGGTEIATEMIDHDSLMNLPCTTGP